MRLFPEPVGRTASKSPPWRSCLIHRNLLFFSQATAKSFIDNGANCLMYYFLKRRSLRHLAYVVSDFSERKVKISAPKGPKANYFLQFIRLLRAIHYFDMRDWEVSIKKSEPRQSETPFVGEREFSKSRGLSASVSFSSTPLPPRFFFFFFFFFCARPVLARPKKEFAPRPLKALAMRAKYISKTLVWPWTDKVVVYGF